MQVKGNDIKHNLHGWVPQEHNHKQRWLANLVELVDATDEPLHPTLREFQTTIEENPKLLELFQLMFEQIPAFPPYDKDPIDRPQVRDYKKLLKTFNVLMKAGPSWVYTTTGQKAMIGVPFNAVLNWPMATEAGATAFLLPEVNTQVKNMLDAWARYLESPASISILSREPGSWFSPEAVAEMGRVASQGYRKPLTFFQAFNCDQSQSESAYGFKSWDHFFTRTFRPGVRPVASPYDSTIIVNACESSPYRITRDVQEHHRFWVKAQPYCLADMLDHHPVVRRFLGGTVYQAFLSALSYHRWHAPVAGTVLAVRNIPGTYFATSYWEGFANRRRAGPHDRGVQEGHVPNPDPDAPVNSQAYTCHVATRALVLIRADDPRIGLVGVLFIGMGEVSSCDVTVREGQRLGKGDELGMFHYGGSTHCLLFEKDVKLRFVREGPPPFAHAGENLPVCGQLAEVLI